MKLFSEIKLSYPSVTWMTMVISNITCPNTEPILYPHPTSAPVSIFSNSVNGNSILSVTQFNHNSLSPSHLISNSLDSLIRAHVKIHPISKLFFLLALLEL